MPERIPDPPFLSIPEMAVQAPGTRIVSHIANWATVRTAAGVEVGRVQAVYTGAGGALLSVDRNGAEVLVPLVKAMVPEVDVVARRIVVDPPEGLLDVNAPAAK